jgi:MFS transporter, DHA3 family, macrolide efflux protein
MLKQLRSEGMSIFTIVWLGQLVSILGSSLSNFAMDVWVYQRNGSVTELSFLILFTTLPIVIVSPFAGVLVDRWDRRWVMILSDTGAALSTSVMALLLISGQIQTWHICLATAVSSSFTAFQFPAYSAATTLLVPKKNLGRAVGMIEFAQAIGQLIAPVLGGILLEVIQISGIFLLDLSSFVFSAIVLLLVRFPRHQALEKQQTYQLPLLKEVFSGFNYVTAHGGLVALLFFLASSTFLLGIVQVLAYPLVLSFASSTQLGIALGVGGVGMIVGSILMGSWGNGRQDYIKILFCSMLLNGFSLMVAGSAPDIIVFGVGALLYFLGVPFINGSVQVILQKKVPLNIQGKVFSLTTAVSGLCLPLAFLMAGPLADRIFEPLMTTNGALAETIGRAIGTGSGRGIGLMFILLGGLNILVTMIAYQYAPLRLIESRLPDAYDGEIVIGDPRLDRRKQHKLIDIMTIGICAVVSGAETWVAIEMYGKDKQDWLSKFLELPNGIPSHETFARVFAAINPEELQQLFGGGVKRVSATTVPEIIAFERKQSRNSGDSQNGKSAMMMVSAWVTSTRLVLGQKKVAGKSNESTALPELIKVLDLAGCVVTINAMACQPKIVKRIVDKDADYVMALTKQQGNLHAQVKQIFAAAVATKFKNFKVSSYRRRKVNGGREEIRNYFLMSDVSSMIKLSEKWINLNSIGLVESVTIINGEISVETRYFINSLEDDVKLFAKSVRSHWGIENSQHWLLDVEMRTDKSQVRTDNTPANFGDLRQIAVNLLDRNKSRKSGVSSKQLLTKTDESCLREILEIML